MPAVLNLNELIKEATGDKDAVILRGDSFGPIKIAYEGPSLVGASATMTFRKNSATGEIVQQLKSVDGEITLDDDAENPIVIERFEPAAAGEIYWDFQLSLSSGAVITLYLDTVEITQDITP